MNKTRNFGRFYQLDEGIRGFIVTQNNKKIDQTIWNCLIFLHSLRANMRVCFGGIRISIFAEIKSFMYIVRTLIFS